MWCVRNVMPAIEARKLMAKCGFVQECCFPTDFSNNLPAQLATIKRTYCNENFSECARHITAMKLDIDSVPYDLHPSDIELAEKLIRAKTASAKPDSA